MLALSVLISTVVTIVFVEKDEAKEFLLQQNWHLVPIHSANYLEKETFNTDFRADFWLPFNYLLKREFQICLQINSYAVSYSSVI